MGRSKQMPRTRDDILPVLLGGDLSIYALGRQFHEAFGVTSIAIHLAFVAAVERSSIFVCRAVPSLQDDVIAREITQIAQAHPAKRVIVMANTDQQIGQLARLLPQLPNNVVCPIPSKEAFELVCHKASFLELCREHGLPVPATQVVDLAGADPAVCTIGFPIIAKAAVSATYNRLFEQGFKKVYALNSQKELDDLVASLRAAGYADPFVLQERIAGDDTHMGAITCYVDSSGALRLWSVAQALLEDHAPTMRGNSVAMLVRADETLRERVEALLAAVGYRGFVEIDVKRDPKTGGYVFFEMNPRIGRNSYICTCGGVNPIRVMVEDLVDGAPHKLHVADEPALYTLVPLKLLYRYIKDPALLAEVKGLVDKKRIFDPQHYAYERNPMRAVLVRATELNQIRKFARYYPEPTESSF